MAEDADPVLTKPGSYVMYPVDASSFPSSIPGAPSTASTTFSSCSPVGRRRDTEPPPDAAVASDIPVPLTVTRDGGACIAQAAVCSRGSGEPAGPHTAPLGYEFLTHASRNTGTRAANVLPKAKSGDRIHIISTANGGSA